MCRYAQKLYQLRRSLLLLSLINPTGAQAVEKIDLIIDTDPGADDVIALLFALASPEELNIRALTTVAGNVRLDKTSRNARLAREWAGREDVPVYAGAPTAADAHAYLCRGHPWQGRSVGCRSCTNRRKVWPRAVRSTYLIDTLKAARPHSITIAMLGPQTNLALALIQEPEIVQGIKEVVIMGGAHFNGGNITPVAEFNLFADPHAAEVVLKSGVKLTYLPLDVTHKILTSDARLKQIAALDNNASKLVGDILNEYIKGDMEYYGIPGGPVHDATVIAYLLKPELFSGRRSTWWSTVAKGRPSVKPSSTGMTASKAPKNAFWVESGDAQGFFDLLTERLARLK